MLFENKYRTTSSSVIDIIREIHDKLYKTSKEFSKLLDLGVSREFDDMLREMVIRAMRSGKEENQWWRGNVPTGTLFFAGYHLSVGVSNTWTNHRTADFINMIAHILVINARAYSNTFPAGLQRMREDAADFEIEPRVFVSPEAKKDTAREIKQSSPQFDSVFAETDTMKYRKAAKNEKNSETSAKIAKAAKKHEEEVLGKRKPLDEDLAEKNKISGNKRNSSGSEGISKEKRRGRER